MVSEPINLVSCTHNWYLVKEDLLIYKIELPEEFNAIGGKYCRADQVQTAVWTNTLLQNNKQE